MESNENALANLVKECETYKSDWFRSGWDAFETALKNAKAVLEKQGATLEEKNKAAATLQTAKDELVKREKYTGEDPFVFPWRKNSNATLEAEFAELHNTGGAEEQWKLSVSDGEWASNKKFINCLNQGDTITVPYKVEKPGTYSVELTYRSGSSTNSLAWEDSAGNVKSGSVVAGNDDSKVTKTVTFDMVAEKAGEGVLTLKGHTKDAPQLDKFEITPKDVKLAEFTVNASVEGEGGTITPSGETKVTEGENVEFKITPDGEVRIIEIGSRMGGDCIGSDLVPLSTGYDFMEMIVDVACGKEPKIVPKTGPKEARIRFLFTMDDVEEMKQYEKEHPEEIYRISELDLSHLGHVSDSSTRLGYYITVKELS